MPFRDASQDTFGGLAPQKDGPPLVQSPPLIGGEMLWFVLGAIAAILQLVFTTRGGLIGFVQTCQTGHPIQGLLVAATLGAAFYGTILWLIFG